MASAFYVTVYVKTNLVTSLERKFRKHYRRFHHYVSRFAHGVNSLKLKSASEREEFRSSPCHGWNLEASEGRLSTQSTKSTYRCSRESNLPQTFWRILHKHLLMEAWKLQLTQLWSQTTTQAVGFLLWPSSEAQNGWRVFSDKVTFHLSSKVSRHNGRVWGSVNPHQVIEHGRNCIEGNMFRSISQQKMYGPFHTGDILARASASWRLCWFRLAPRWRSSSLLLPSVVIPDNKLSQRWMRWRTEYEAPRPPDLTSCHHFLWGYAKGTAYRHCQQIFRIWSVGSLKQWH